jgi:hypothetical protein
VPYGTATHVALKAAQMCSLLSTAAGGGVPPGTDLDSDSTLEILSCARFSCAVLSRACKSAPAFQGEKMHQPRASRDQQ